MVEQSFESNGGAHAVSEETTLEGWRALIALERRIALAEARADAAEQAAKLAIEAVEGVHTAIAWISRILAASGAAIAWWAAYRYYG